MTGVQAKQKMANIPRTHEDIEARIKEIQSRKKELSAEENGVTDKSRIELGESGYFDQEIYGGGGSKFDGYVTSIAANDEVDDDDYEMTTFSQKRPGYNAPVALLNDIAQSEKDYDPFAETRRPTIAEKEDEYRQKRRRMIISPDGIDPFAEGGKTPDIGSRSYTEIMREQMLRGEKSELRKKIVEKSKEGTLKVSNGDASSKAASAASAKKRGEWDQGQEAESAPSKKKVTTSSWDKDDSTPAHVEAAQLL